MSRKARSENGQIFPLMARGLLTLLLGIAALVMVENARYRAHRHVRAAAIAALASVHDLPLGATVPVGLLAR